jgi:hypothetical protein
VAVHQTLGIGLGFNFDHMGKPNAADVLSTRRLQARAAKSAIRRAQELYNAETAREILDQIPDPVERDRKAAQLRQDADAEIQYLAQRLSDLIPTDKSLEDREKTTMEQYRATNKFKRTSENEYLVDSPTLGEPSVVIDQLLRSQQKESTEIGLDPSGRRSDGDFLEVYLKQSRNQTDADNDSDAKDGFPTILA